jgi:hypothetical protein
MATAFFLMRINDHIQYMNKIEATLAGKDDFKGTDHHDCKLGKWLYNEGVKEVAELQNSNAQEIFESLFEPHERFHQISKEVLEKKPATDDDENYQTALTEMCQLSQTITQKLLDLDALA